MLFRPLLSLLVLASLAGCASTLAPPTAPIGEDDAGTALRAPLFAAQGCRAVNGFSMLDEGSLKPHVPDNWTFTGRQGFAILRTFVILCAESSTAILATPMAPDEASAAHHDNPDVVIEAYATDAAEVARWNAAGVPARLAQITETAALGQQAILVTTDAGDALELRLLGIDVPLQPYEWRAVYASGKGDAIAWFWGDERSPSATGTQFQARPGPASALAGAQLVGYSASRWDAFDITYAQGLPDETA